MTVRRPVRLAVIAAAVAVAAAVAAPARAQCGRPDVQHAVPPDGAGGVPTDARLQARYAIGAEYLGEEVTLARTGFGADPVPAEFDSAERVLSVVPPAGLAPGGEYTVVWPRLRGIGTATKGRGRTVTFTVGQSDDAEPPRFDGIRSMTWDLDVGRDDCTDSLEERFTFGLRLHDATDDGGDESLMLLVFQTSGSGIGAGLPEPIHVVRYPSSGKTRVKRVVGDAIGDVCFAAIVRDLTGKISASAADEVCAKTIEPPFFDGCRAAPSPPRGGASLALSLALAAAVRRRRRPR